MSLVAVILGNASWGVWEFQIKQIAIDFISFLETLNNTNNKASWMFYVYQFNLLKSSIF